MIERLLKLRLYKAMENQIRISYLDRLILIIKPNEKDVFKYYQSAGNMGFNIEGDEFNQEELNELINLAVIVQNSKIQYDLNIEFYMVREE